MPAARLLALAPASGPPLQLLRSASSAGSSTTNTARSTTMSTTMSTRPRPAVALLPGQAGTRTGSLSGCRARATQQRPLPAGARAFGAATMPKHVAFPRHGKAVAPEAATVTAQRPGAQGTEASPAPPAREKQPAERATAKDDAAAAASAPPAAATTTSTDTRAIPLGPPSAKVDAQGALGRTDGPSASTSLSDAASIAAEAAAAAVTAAETASVAASIVGGAAPEPELSLLRAPRGGLDGDAQAGNQTTAVVATKALQSAAQSAAQTAQTTAQTAPRQPLSQSRPAPPHMAPPPYVHHFDSYSLVKQLEAGGYSKEQAVTAMKAVRSLLAQNLDVAQSSLVSKSDVENEAYLFKAACAELSIEVRNNRRRADELTRQQRTLLQHEVDIAAQSVNQELVTLADVVKELFNDRKMVVREEQKTLESAIQQLSYKITIMLNSEMRSEIEALRWVLIRRSVLGIIFMAILTLGSLRYASYLAHKKQRAAERALREAREAEETRFAGANLDTSAPPDAAEILAAN